MFRTMCFLNVVSKGRLNMFLLISTNYSEPELNQKVFYKSLPYPPYPEILSFSDDPLFSASFYVESHPFAFLFGREGNIDSILP